MEFIDFRSDTVTMPTKEMLDAMRNASAGDDVYGDDKTVNLLEKKSAEILGKESAIFVPSGTFGNQLALLTHTLRGDEVIIPADNHIVLYEVAAAAVIAGVQLRLTTENNGKIDIEELKKMYRIDDIHNPRTGLICMENAHSAGKVVPMNNMLDVCKFAKSLKIPVHLDGARIFNAAIALKINPREIAVNFDSIMFCFSKGLCAPVGSILAGSMEFINKARKNRKLMGGGMRQVGFIAAPCIVALDKMIDRLKEDHENAKYLASRLEETEIFEVFKERLDINMVFCSLKKEITDYFNEKAFINYLREYKIKINPSEYGEFRFVTHYWISKENINYFSDLIKKLPRVIFRHS
ncbi:MAG: threonine aldolase family protein [Actinobacteria bacterium]|nr:threonine aldolase family protein [Actinomycetota bacterium]